MKCIIPFCKNYEINHPVGVRFFRITKDRYPTWMLAIRRMPEPVPKFSRKICSEHFTPDSFKCIGGKVSIRDYAVPTLKLRPFQQTYISELANVSNSLRTYRTNTGNSNVATTKNSQTSSPARMDLTQIGFALKRMIGETSSTNIEEFTSPSHGSRVSDLDHDYCSASVICTNIPQQLNAETLKVGRSKSHTGPSSVHPKVMNEELNKSRDEQKAFQIQLKSTKARINRMQKKINHLKSVVTVLSKKNLSQWRAVHYFKQNIKLQ